MKYFIIFFAISAIFISVNSCSNSQDPPTSDSQDPPTSEDTINIPTLQDNGFTLQTLPILNINPYDASSGGKIVAKSEYFSYNIIGVCWSENPNPTINNNYEMPDYEISDYENNYAFQENINGDTYIKFKNLKPNTTYYVRAFLKKESGVYSGNQPIYKLYYGNVIAFTTLSVDFLKIGQNYAGGIIAYILKEGDSNYIPNETHGLIVHPIENNYIRKWGCQVDYLYATANSKIGDGYKNTFRILRKGCNNEAASYCSKLFTDNYCDWYLPSYFEIKKIRIIHSMGIGGLINNSIYWSSTEATGQSSMTTYLRALSSSFSSTNYYEEDIQYNQNEWTDKTESHRVRAVRFF